MKMLIMKKKVSKQKYIPKLRQKNNLLYEQLEYTGSVQAPTEYIVTIYDEDTVMQKKYFDVEEVIKLKQKGKNIWLHVRGLSDVESIEKLCISIGLPVLWIQDVLNDRHIAKIEESSEMAFTVIDAYEYNVNMELEKDHLSLILGEKFILSFQETHTERFQLIRQALVEDIGKVRSNGVDYLYNLLLSKVVELYLFVLDKQRDQLLEMEDELMEFDSVREEMGKGIQHYRKDYMRLRKNVMPLKDEFHEILELNSNLVKEETKIYFQDTYDQLLQVFQLIESTKESIASLVDLYMANTDMRMNHIMKRLTVVSTIFIPLTFLVGVWGMNFHYMPELTWKWGYLFAWLSMLIVGVIVYIWLRHKKWY